MSSTGDCFVVLPPHTVEGSIIFGRNSEDPDALGEAQEVCFFDANTAVEGKCDGGAEPEMSGNILRLILQRPRPSVWGGDYGANECNVCVGVAWSGPSIEGTQLTATDLVRCVLATATSAAVAVERVGSLVQEYGLDGAKFSLIICDPTEVWAISCAGKLWAAQRFERGLSRFPSGGLAVTTQIDKASDGLKDALKTLGVWSGEDELNFAACFGAAATSTDSSWIGDEPKGDGSYTLISMFGTLRAAAVAEKSRSATVSVLCKPGIGISCHWFTATPNASESVFKPFFFAPNPKISPLIRASPESGQTLLHKLHAQRKPAAVENLRALEASCVNEVNKYLSEHPEVDEELDELMKDCVEAEVKFYR